MTKPLQFELFRLRSARRTGLVIALILLLGVIFGAFQGDADLTSGPGILAVVVNATLILPIIASVLPAQAIGQEYRFGLIRQTVTLFPDRTRIFAAKWLVSSLVATVAVVLAYAGSVFAAMVASGSSVDIGALVNVLTREGLYVIGYCVFVFAGAALTRQVALGVFLPLMAGLFIEGGLLEELMNIPADLLPLSAGSAFKSAASGGWDHLLVFGGYAAILFLLSLVVFRRQDA